MQWGIRLTVAVVMGILAGTLGFIFGTVFQFQAPWIWVTTGVAVAAAFLGSFFARGE